MIDDLAGAGQPVIGGPAWRMTCELNNSKDPTLLHGRQ